MELTENLKDLVVYQSVSALQRCERLSLAYQESKEEIRKLVQRLGNEQFDRMPPRAPAVFASAKASDDGTKRVEDSLMDRHRKSKLKIERMRREKILEEESACSHRPTINSKSRRLAESAAGADLPTRSAQFSARKEARTKNLRDQLEMSQGLKMQRRPKINEKSKRMARSRSVDAMLEWKERRELRNEAKRRLREAEEARRLKSSAAPKINERSKRIVAARSRGRPRISAGERLNADAERRRDRMVRREIEAKRQERISARPVLVSTISANYERSEPVSDRLYNSARLLETKKIIRARRAEMISTPAFVPKIDKKSRAIASEKSTEESVADRLSRKAEEYKQRVERRRKREEMRVDKMAARTSATSRRKKGGAKPSATLHRPIGNIRPSTISEMRRDETFSPRLVSCGGGGGAAASHSSQKTSHRHIESERRQREWVRMRDRRQEEAKRQADKDRADVCTFRPKINRSTRKKKKTSVGNENEDDIASRSRRWLERKDRRQQEMRTNREKAALEECTFRPRMMTTANGCSSTTKKKATGSDKKKMTPKPNEEEDVGWNRHETEDGYVYFHNPKTGTTRWADESEVL